MHLAAEVVLVKLTPATHDWQTRADVQVQSEDTYWPAAQVRHVVHVGAA